MVSKFQQKDDIEYKHLGTRKKGKVDFVHDLGNKREGERYEYTITLYEERKSKVM